MCVCVCVRARSFPCHKHTFSLSLALACYLLFLPALSLTLLLCISHARTCTLFLLPCVSVCHTPSLPLCLSLPIAFSVCLSFSLCLALSRAVSLALYLVSVSHCLLFVCATHLLFCDFTSSTHTLERLDEMEEMRSEVHMLAHSDVTQLQWQEKEYVMIKERLATLAHRVHRQD